MILLGSHILVHSLKHIMKYVPIVYQYSYEYFYSVCQAIYKIFNHSIFQYETTQKRTISSNFVLTVISSPHTTHNSPHRPPVTSQDSSRLTLPLTLSSPSFRHLKRLITLSHTESSSATRHLRRLITPHSISSIVLTVIPPTTHSIHASLSHILSCPSLRHLPRHLMP